MMYACGAGLTAANGLYTLDTTWLTSCSGGVINVTVAFNDPKELYGVSTAVVQVTVVGTCLPVSPLNPAASSSFKLASYGSLYTCAPKACSVASVYVKRIY